MASLDLPAWAHPDSRYAKNLVNYLWTNGKQYNHILNHFSDSKDNKGRAIKLWDKRPSVILNMPALSARISARRLFVGKHAPAFEFPDDGLKDSFDWLADTSNLFWHGLDCARQGQAGSAAFILKVVDGKPIIQVKPGKDCTPEFGDDGELLRFEMAYIIRGYEWLNKDAGKKDCNGAEISPDSQYWFIKIWTTEAVVTCLPIPVADWNPETGFAAESSGKKEPVPDLSDFHNLGFVPVVWVKNMPDGDSLDGLSSYGLALPNCTHLDYTMSQFGRGLNYMANPTVFAKGKILTNGGSMSYGMDNFIQMPPDKRTAAGDSVSGADVKLLEMNGDGIKVGMEMWVEKMREWTKGLMSQSNLDHNKIKGQLSGSAIMLLDEDFFDGVELMKTPYGRLGIMKVIVMLARMLAIAGNSKFKGKGKSAEYFEELKPDWPATYEPEPQELQFLVDALNNAIAGGLMNVDEGSEILSMAVDKELTATEPEENDMLEQPGKGQDADIENKKKEVAVKQKIANKPAPKPAVKKK
jgi:hypothetical protein